MDGYDGAHLVRRMESPKMGMKSGEVWASGGIALAKRTWRGQALTNAARRRRRVTHLVRDFYGSGNAGGGVRR